MLSLFSSFGQVLALVHGPGFVGSFIVLVGSDISLRLFCDVVDTCGCSSSTLALISILVLCGA